MTLNMIMSMAVFMVIGVVMRQLVLATIHTMPFHFAVTLSGIFLGLLAHSVEVLKNPMELESAGRIFGTTYLTLVMFEAGLGTDTHYIKLVFTHLVCFILPLFTMQFIAMVTLGMYVFPYDFSAEEYIMMMSIAMTPGPQITKTFLTIRSAPPDLKMLLLGETSFGNCIVWSVFRIALLKQYTDMINVLVQLLLNSLGGLLIGYTVGKVTIYWISHIFKDIVNQITIVIGFVFGANALCQILGFSGLWCALCIGLVLSDQKASLTVKSTQTLQRFLDVFIFVMTSVVCISGGLYISILIFPLLSAVDVIMSVVIFVVCLVVRSLVLLVTFPLTKRYITHKTHLAILCSCTLRGSYSVVMAFSLLDKAPFRRKDDSLFTVAMLQILIAFLVNPLITSRQMDKLNKEKLISVKAVPIERAARILNALKNSVLHALQNQSFTADADWDVVNKQTTLRHDFMKRFQGSRHLKGGRENNRGSDPWHQLIEWTRMKDDAIRQILLAEKSSYSRQYEEGVITRHAVLNLSYFINICLKMKMLMNPNTLIRKEKKLGLMQRIETELTDMINYGLPPPYIRFLVVSVFSIDILITTFSLNKIVFNFFNDPDVIFTILYNSAFLTVYVCIVFIEAFRAATWKPQNMWHYVHRTIVVFTILDLLITSIPLTYPSMQRVGHQSGTPSHSNIFHEPFLLTSFLCTLTRFFRSIQLFQVIPLLQDFLLRHVRIKEQKKIFIEFDMVRGFQSGIADTLRKVSTVTQDRQLAKALGYTRHKCKLLVVQHLGLSQIRYESVMLALKTKMATRITLNAQEQALMEITRMGLLGTLDEQLLLREIKSLMIKLRSFPYAICLNSQNDLLRHIPWVDGDEIVLKHLQKNSHQIRFLPGDVIVTQGHMPEGIFLILSGLVRGECLLERPMINAAMPNYSRKNREPYISQTIFGAENMGLVELSDFHTRGNVIGELSFLTDKPGHKTYRCATIVETLFIRSDQLHLLTEGKPSPTRPMHLLEKKIWRTVAIRQALRYLKSDPSSPGLSRTTTYSGMMDAYIVDGNTIRFVSITPNEVSMVFLVQGSARHVTSDVKFVGPCIIPFDCQKLQSLPDKGPRVVFLFVTSPTLEGQEVIEGVASEEFQIDDEEDNLTICSGSSGGQPFRRVKNSIYQCDDRSVFNERFLQAWPLKSHKMSTAL